MKSSVFPTRSALSILAGAALLFTGHYATAAGASRDPEFRTPPVRASYQTWNAISFQGPIYDDLLFFADFQARLLADMFPSQLLVQPAIGYRLPQGFSVFAGYGYTPVWNDAHERTDEHVAWQQVAFAAPFTELKLTARVRLEERFREDSNTVPRLRTMLRMNIPLKLPIPLQTVFWDEIFIGLTQGEPWQPEVFDQNQLFLGLGWVFDRHFRLDVGYLSQIVPRNDTMAARHCLSLNGAVTW